MDQRHPIAERLQRLTGSRQRVPVAIDPDERRRTGGEQRAGVPAESHRAIDEHAAPRGREMLNHLAHHHRFVHNSHQGSMHNAQGSVLNPEGSP